MSINWSSKKDLLLERASILPSYPNDVISAMIAFKNPLLPLTIIDVDNVISNDEMRFNKFKMSFHHKEKSRDELWDIYHRQSIYDHPANENIVKAAYQAGNVLFATAMPEQYRVHRIRWLTFNHFFDFRNMNFASIIMRPMWDYDSSINIKKDWAKIIQKLGINIVMAYDDRPGIIDAYKSLDIPCEHIFIRGYDEDSYAKHD